MKIRRYWLLDVFVHKHIFFGKNAVTFQIHACPNRNELLNRLHNAHVAVLVEKSDCIFFFISRCVRKLREEFQMKIHCQTACIDHVLIDVSHTSYNKSKV